jgi:dCMP deaminase
MKKFKRPDIPLYFSTMCLVVAKRSTCIRRQVGCILVDERQHVLSMGYNGAPKGLPHCIDIGCQCKELHGETKFEDCIAVHAEENALIQCPDAFRIRTCYITKCPCKRCLRMLMNTSCKYVIFFDEKTKLKVISLDRLRNESRIG